MLKEQDQKILGKLPTFFRSQDGKKPDVETIKKYIETLKQNEGL